MRDKPKLVNYMHSSFQEHSLESWAFSLRHNVATDSVQISKNMNTKFTYGSNNSQFMSK